jgi:hypothetical protein
MVSTDDIVQVVVHSDKDRCRCVAQVNPCAGVKVLLWIGCERGHSLKTVDPMQTSLLLTDHGNFKTIDVVGEVARETDDKAMVGILATGLRNDVGGEVGRTSIMCGPYGPNGPRGNMYLQRERGSVRVGIGMMFCWGQVGAAPKLEFVPSLPGLGLFCSPM